MDINYTVSNLFDALALFQGLIFGLILVIGNRKNRPSLYLGLFLITYSLDLVRSILMDTGIASQHPELRFLPFNFYFLTIPFFYLYAKSLIQPVSLVKYFGYLVLGVIELLVFSWLFLLPVARKQEIVKLPNTSFVYSSYQLVSILFSVALILWVIRLVSKHKTNVLNNFSNASRLHLGWVRTVAIFLLVYYLLAIFLVYLPVAKVGGYFYVFISFLNVIFIYWVAISGLSQHRIDINEPMIEVSKTKLTKGGELEKQKMSDLRKLVSEKELFKNQGLSLQQLSEHFGLSAKDLSRLINQYGETNFNNFINQFRLEQAKVLLADPEFDHLNMVGIADEVGFSSKATFFAVFKKNMGVSPGKFKISTRKSLES